MTVSRRRLRNATEESSPAVEAVGPLDSASLTEAFAEGAGAGVVPRASPHTSRAGVRSEEREPVHAPARSRRRRSTVTEDIFYIPLDEIPEGSSYEWKRWTLHGQEDPFYIAGLREQGWEPVDPKRHPNWVPPGYSQPYIIKGGQILMERPIELTEEARAESRQFARRQVKEAEQRLGMTPKDTGTRSLPEVAPRVVKEVGRMIPQAVED